MDISIEPLSVPLTKPYGYYFDTLSELPYARLRVSDNAGYSGAGEIACAFDITGESRWTAYAVSDHLAHLLSNIDVNTADDIKQILERVELSLSENRAVKCGLEHALTRYVASKQNCGIAEIIGAGQAPAAPVQCAVPFLTDLDEYEARFRDLLTCDPAYIKLKVGAHRELEQRALRLLRRMNKRVSISIDANQAFTNARDARNFLEEIGQVDICWAEQLIPAHTPAEWHTLRAVVNVPLMADESIHTELDAAYFLEHDLVDVINVKTAKSGGIRRAREIAHKAYRYNVPVMLGSMLHSEEGHIYNLAFGTSEKCIAYDMASYFSLSEYTREPIIDPASLHITNAILYE